MHQTTAVHLTVDELRSRLVLTSHVFKMVTVIRFDVLSMTDIFVTRIRDLCVCFYVR